MQVFLGASSMKKLVVWFAVLLLSLTSSFAAQVTHKDIVNTVYLHGDYAQYQVTLTNEKLDEDRYLITPKDVYWSIKAIPLTDYTTGLDVGKNSSVTTILLIKPKEDVVPRVHTVPVEYFSPTTGDKTMDVYKIVVEPDPLIPIHYDPNVTIFVVVPEIFGLGKTNSVKVSLLNNNPLDLQAMDIQVKSAFFQQATTVSIGPREDKIVDFSIPLDKSLGDTSGTLEIIVLVNDTLLYHSQHSFTTSPAGFVKEINAVAETFFTKLTTYTYTNVGTTSVEYTLRIPTTYWESMFTHTEPVLKLMRAGDEVFYMTTVSLQPQQSLDVTVTTQYSVLLYVILLIFLVLFLYYMLRSPLIIVKEASKVDIVEGGIASIHVVVSVRNRSSRLLKPVKIIDKVPAIAMVEKKTEDLKPTKVYPFFGGTAVQFDIHALDPREQAIVNYTMKTKLSVLGNMRLPPAIVQYGVNGKKAYSNPVDVYAP